MRHTLLPTTEKTIIRREYYVRITIVACFVVSLAIISGIIALIPAYIYARNEEKGSLATISELKKGEDASGRVAIQAELKSDQLLLSDVAANASRPRVSALIGEIVSARGNVKISAMDLSAISTSTALILIQGVAPTRNALLSFKGRLESLRGGAQTELPISELAASSNVRFSMRLSYPLP